MKVLHFISGLGVGGAERMLARLVISSTNGKSHKHVVVSLREMGPVGEELLKSGIEVYSLNMNRLSGIFLALPRMAALLRLSKPDVVQTWMYHADFICGLVARLMGLRTIIWGVRTTHPSVGNSLSTSVLARLCALGSRLIPRAIVCAAGVSRQHHVELGYDASKMVVIPNGFNLDAFHVEQTVVEQLRQQLGVEKTATIIGTVGRFNDAKDYKNLIKAAALLLKDRDDLVFLMVGKGLDDTNLELCKWLVEYKVRKYFVLAGEQKDLACYYFLMDIFCLPSRTEGFPNVLGEAMACSRPCVSTDVGDAAFLLGDTGIIVKKEDDAELANGLRGLLEKSSDELDCLGRSAHERIKMNFTMDVCVLQFERLYSSIVSGC
ncbi:glycosyltransferase [Pseudomonas asplenii]|uniref:glycosyltransferase n=1 Tax=Pseudomonas asplenii TaxID=53407 RepID=UPI0037C9E217